MGLVCCWGSVDPMGFGVGAIETHPKHCNRNKQFIPQPLNNLSKLLRNQ